MRSRLKVTLHMNFRENDQTHYYPKQIAVKHIHTLPITYNFYYVLFGTLNNFLWRFRLIPLIKVLTQ